MTLIVRHLRLVGEDEPTIYVQRDRGYIELTDCEIRVCGAQLHVKHRGIFEGEWTKVVLP